MPWKIELQKGNQWGTVTQGAKTFVEGYFACLEAASKFYSGCYRKLDTKNQVVDTINFGGRPHPKEPFR